MFEMNEKNQKKSNRGGKRAGAGRKAGAVNKKTREIADRAINEGITPLEVMLEAMREAYESGGAIAACAFAEKAAPYIHPKMSSVEHKGDPENPVHVNAGITMSPGAAYSILKGV